jgi:uncharacterized protein (DUF885 family)
MKRILVLLILPALAAVYGMKQVGSSHTSVGIDDAFEHYKAYFIEEMWKVYPGAASGAGYHKYDSILVVPDQVDFRKQLSFTRVQLDSLAKYMPDQLSAHNRTDFFIIKDYLQSIQFSINELKAYQWDPSGYNVNGGFSEMLANNYDSLDNRLRNFYLRLKKVPAYYDAAMKNIQHPTVEHTQLAIDQNLGGLSVFEKDLPEALAKSHLSKEEQSLMLAEASKAVNAVHAYTDWLKNLKDDAPRSFRLGTQLYAKKFSYDIQSHYSAEEIYHKALAARKQLHSKMAKLTFQLWPKYMENQAIPKDTLKAIRELIDKISVAHVQPDSFQTAIEKQIPVLVNFIKEKDLIYLDPSKPLVVRKEPAYMAGVAGASISAPGPYDAKGNTYYNVGSMAGWTRERQESYLREYNHYILQILNIHEAIPGHYVQLVYSNKSPSMIKSLLGNSAMIEGWAVYTERMMLENGYGNNEAEMWLMYYKWNLRTVCNTILDYSVHCKNMTKEEALDLLINKGFQQQAEAENKWKRVSLTQVQLCCYFTGFTEISELREELKKKQGTAFNLKQFHEQFLNYGSAPVKYIRELMMK